MQDTHLITDHLLHGHTPAYISDMSVNFSRSLSLSLSLFLSLSLSLFLSPIFHSPSSHFQIPLLSLLRIRRTRGRQGRQVLRGEAGTDSRQETDGLYVFEFPPLSNSLSYLGVVQVSLTDVVST